MTTDPLPWQMHWTDFSRWRAGTPKPTPVVEHYATREEAERTLAIRRASAKNIVGTVTPTPEPKPYRGRRR